MNYKEKYNLQDDEKVSYVGEIHPINAISDYNFWFGLMVIIASQYFGKSVMQQNLEVLLYIGIFLTFLGLLKGFIYLKTTDYLITNKRFLAKIGLIKRDIIEIDFNKIESISLSQSILGRVLNYGTIYCSGVGSNGVKIINISKPLFFKSILSRSKNISV